MPAIRDLNGDGGKEGKYKTGGERRFIQSAGMLFCVVKGFFLFVIGSGYLTPDCQSVTQQESNYRAVLMNLDFATGVQLLECLELTFRISNDHVMHFKKKKTFLELSGYLSANISVLTLKIQKYVPACSAHTHTSGLHVCAFVCVSVWVTTKGLTNCGVI